MEFIVTSKSYTIIKKKKEYSFYKLTSVRTIDLTRNQI